jgi:hypothetical protein
MNEERGNEGENKKQNKTKQKWTKSKHQSIFKGKKPFHSSTIHIHKSMFHHSPSSSIQPNNFVMKQQNQKNCFC